MVAKSDFCANRNLFEGVPSDVEMQDAQIEKEEQVLKLFDAWSRIHVSKSDDRRFAAIVPTMDPKYEGISSSKVEFAGKTDLGELVIKRGDGGYDYLPDTHESRVDILQRHKQYMQDVVSVNVHGAVKHPPSAESLRLDRTFEVWSKRHVAQQDGETFDPRYASIYSMKVTYGGRTSDGFLKIYKGGLERLYPDNPASKAAILKQHNKYMEAVVLVNNACADNCLNTGVAVEM